MSEKKHMIKMSESGQLSFGDITKTLSDLPSFKTPKWEIIDTKEQLEVIALELAKLNVIGLDIETTGLDPYFSDVRLIQISPSEDLTYVLDMKKIKSLESLKHVFSAEKPVKVIHNAVFEQKFLKYKYDLKFGNIFDTMLANKLIYNGIYKSNSLQEVVKDQLGLFLDKDMQTSSWQDSDLSRMQLDYASKDSAILLPLREKQIEKIIEYKLVEVAKLEFDCTKAVTEIEHNGVFIDKTILDEFKKEIEERLQALTISLRKFFGDININSYKQISAVLASKGIYTENTSESELKAYANEYPAIKDFIEYKSLYKKLTSTIESLENNINKKTKRVHSSYNQMGATSGRMSSHNPNLQNIPRGEMRSIFRAPNNRKLIIADYSQIELRIIAEISEDPTLINAFRSNQDIHNITASIITHKDIDGITKDDRQKAKAVNFGLVYGMGAKGLVRYASSSFNIEMSNVEAEEVYYKFFQKYEGIRIWHNKVKASSNDIEYLETLSGRKRFFKSDKRHYAELFNTPVQGTGADILKLALIYLHEEFDNSSTMLINTVHDEVIVECDENKAESISKIVNNLMVSAGNKYIKKVPVVVDVNIANTWAEK
ncbi:MAG: DNA polymerase [Clostridia bacterium]